MRAELTSVRWRGIGTFFLALFAITIISAAPHAEDFDLPNAGKHIVDSAGQLKFNTKSEIENLLARHERTANVRIMAVIVASLRGRTIAETGEIYRSLLRFDAIDGGKSVLLIVAQAEKTAGIEVGRVLEDQLSAADIKTIIDHTISPGFEAQTLDRGIVEAVTEILKRTGGDYLFSDERGWLEEFADSRWGGTILAIVGGLFVLITPFVVYAYHKVEVRNYDRYLRIVDYKTDLRGLKSNSSEKQIRNDKI